MMSHLIKILNPKADLGLHNARLGIHEIQVERFIQALFTTTFGACFLANVYY